MPAVDWLESDNPTTLVRKIVTNAYLAAIDTPPSTRPVNSVPPALDNTHPKQGDTITADEGTWTNTPTSFAWLWYRNGSSTGVTTEDYTTSLADVGKTLKRRTIATNASGNSFPVFSNQTEPVFALIYSGGTVDPEFWSATPDTLVYDGHDVYIDPFATSLNILQAVDGDLDVTPIEATLVSLQTGSGVLNSYNAHNCAMLNEVYTFSLSIDIEGCSSATSIFAQGVTDASVSLVGCTGVSYLVHFSLCPNITTIDYSPCAGITSVYATECSSLTSISVEGLTAITQVVVQHCGLTSLPDFSSSPSINQFELEDNALPEAEADGILAYLVTVNFSGVINLSGGTNSPPSASGLADKATLESNGATVTVNS